MILVRCGALLGNETKNMGLIFDREGHSPLDLLSILLKERYHSSGMDGGDVYSFGKADFQVGETDRFELNQRQHVALAWL